MFKVRIEDGSSRWQVMTRFEDPCMAPHKRGNEEPSNAVGIRYVPPFVDESKLCEFGCSRVLAMVRG